MRQKPNLACAVFVLLAGSATVRADDPDWPTMPFTPHSDFQAVDGDGAGTFPLTDPVKLRGVILNDPRDMLDPTPGSNPFMGGQ